MAKSIKTIYKCDTCEKEFNPDQYHAPGCPYCGGESIHDTGIPWPWQDVTDVMKLDDDTQREIIQQYEDIRRSGLTNMFNYTNVKYIAKKLVFDALYNFIKNDMKCYTSILKNFSILMKKFDIQQN